MARVLVDTSVLVEADRGRLDLSAVLQAAATDAAMSVITASELLAGAARMAPGLARMKTERRVEALLDLLPVIPLGLDVARVHAGLVADLERRGQSLGTLDLLIAATALAHEYELATRDRAFDRVPGLVVHHW